MLGIDFGLQLVCNSDSNPNCKAAVDGLKDERALTKKKARMTEFETHTLINAGGLRADSDPNANPN